MHSSSRHPLPARTHLQLSNHPRLTSTQQPTNTRQLLRTASCPACSYVSFVEILSTKAVSGFQEAGYEDAVARRYACFSFFAGLMVTWLLSKAVSLIPAAAGAWRKRRVSVRLQRSGSSSRQERRACQQAQLAVSACVVLTLSTRCPCAHVGARPQPAGCQDGVSSKPLHHHHPLSRQPQRGSS